MPTHVVLLRGVNNLGGKMVAMAELREVVTSLGHTDVMTYIQSGNVLFTPRLADSETAGRADTAALAAELERAIADSIGVQARAVVLSREELARCAHDNPYPGETNPKLLHAVFLPEVPGPGLAAWVADAERRVRANGSRDEAQVLGRAVYLHTPDGYPRSELRRVLAKAGGPTLGRSGRNGAQLGDSQQAGQALRILTYGHTSRARDRMGAAARVLGALLRLRDRPRRAGVRLRRPRGASRGLVHGRSQRAFARRNAAHRHAVRG